MKKGFLPLWTGGWGRCCILVSWEQLLRKIREKIKHREHARPTYVSCSWQGKAEFVSTNRSINLAAVDVSTMTLPRNSPGFCRYLHTCLTSIHSEDSQSERGTLGLSGWSPYRVGGLILKAAHAYILLTRYSSSSSAQLDTPDWAASEKQLTKKVSTRVIRCLSRTHPS